MSVPTAVPQRDADFWIQQLGLSPHPEGGFFREVVHSVHKVNNEAGRERHAYTTVYHLLTPASPSHLHRLQSDETWMYHAGDPLQVHVILKDALDEDRIAVPPRAPPAAETSADAAAYQVYRCVAVGPRVDQGEQLQYTVPGGAIFGSSVNADGAMGQHGYALVSCVVSPGFDYKDFELFTQEQLMKVCPQHEEMIRKMAYETISEENMH